MAPSRKKGASKAAAAAAARRQYKIGDLVLAKVKGFPAWPATVSEPEKWGYPPDWKKILVYFFGTQQIAFCNPADVEAFTEEKKQSLLGKRHGKGADFGRAVREIIESYEQMKKQDHASNTDAVDDAIVIGEGSVELSVKSLVDGDVAYVASKSCDREVAKEDDVNAKSEIGAGVNGRNGSEEKDTREKEEDRSTFLAAETALTNRDSSRENSERTVEPKYFTRRRPPTRRARTASRVGSNKPQLRATRSSTVAPSVLSDEPDRRNKRIRKSPDYEHAVDSPGLISNGSIEGNDSEILTADSDSFSLNDGSTVDSKCKNAVPESKRECEENIELGQRLEFQTNGISKKKRMPNRKRPSSDTVELTAKLGEKISSDAKRKTPNSNTVELTAKPGEKISSDACERIIPGDQEISTKKQPKEAGDEHLPLVKRARVRMGRISAGEQPETSFDTEEKPPEVCSSMSDHVHVSSDREGDDSSDRKPSSAKGELKNSLRPDKHQTVKHQVWEARKYQHLGSSVEGEAALPPSKRLHRALEAMSANAAEDNQTASDVPSTAKVDTSGCCSSASDDCSKSYLERKLGDESEIGTAEENVRDIKSQDGASECSMKIDPSLTEERVTSGETATCYTEESGKQKPCENNVDNNSDKSMLKSPADPIDNRVAVQSSESLLLKEGCSPGVRLPSDDDCKTGSSKLAKPCETNDHQTNLTVSSIHCGVDMEIDRADDHGANHVSEVKLTLNSPHSGTEMETNIAGDECGGTVISRIVPHESKLSTGMSKKDVGNTPSMEDSSATLFPVAADVSGNNTEKKDRSHSTSAAGNHSGDRITSVRKSSPSPTNSLEAATGARPRTSTSKMSTSLNSSIQVDSSRSSVSHTHHDVQKSAGKWNFKEAQDALKSFEGFLGTLTRTKENINRATRSAIDCAKFGVATKVIEILTHSLERETNLPKRVDLFFLVDSIAQHSRGLKGDVAGVYPSAILPVLPRLLSAAAPPGSNSQDNRKQCLKVLKVWQDRRILPESIVRHHIRELESLCGSSCPRALSRRQRNERAFDDPIREMEGMLVDEYGSNSSIHLPGFSMPAMLKDEDDGVDSDGESFEAVTPEHETGKSEVDGNHVEKHRHILEDVDGELEMEDVAPSSDNLISSTDSSATNTVQKMHTVGNVTFAPPLPRDFPPISPPLPRSPPPLPQLPLPPPPPLPPHLAPRASFPLPSDKPDNPSSSAKPKDYNSSQSNGDDLRQSNVPPVNPTLPDAAPSSRPNQIEFHSQVPKQLSNSTPLNTRPISNLPVRGAHNAQHSDSGYNKGFRLRPPHPAPSNQFSYVQNDHRVQSRRDIPPPPPPHPNRYHVQHTENGNFYREADGMAPHDTGDHWRGPPLPGPRYPDGSRMNYAPAPYGGQPGEPVHGNRWGYPHGEMNHRMAMPHRPPAGAPIPVAARGPNCWRPPR